jgi:FKBP-type peptidyl-prolyl cis-trans isomerase SlpA
LISSADSAKAVVRPDSYLTLHYRITLATGPAAGSVFVSTFEDRPATLQLGNGQWASGMEEALIGREEGEQFQVDLPAADAYGARNPELVQRVADSLIEAYTEPGTVFNPGDIVEFSAPNGGRYSGIFKERGDGWALFDFNHPLAGVDLRLDISLLGVL